MKRMYLILSLLIGFKTVFGQIQFISNNQYIVEEAIENGLFISRQSFQICDKKTGELFGLNGEKEFGIQYSFGVKIPGGFLLNDKAVRPWIYNDKYEKYQHQYDPVFYQAKYSDVSQEAKYDSLGYTLVGMQELVDSTMYSFSSETFGGNGFVLDYSEGDKKGWIVWITIDKDTDLSNSAKLNYTIYQKDLTVGDLGEVHEIVEPNLYQTILGGIYVVPYYTKIGVVEFRLCGVVAKSKVGWRIHCPFVGMESKISSEQKPKQEVKEEDGDTSELTPVGKDKNKDKKKRKK